MIYKGNSLFVITVLFFMINIVHSIPIVKNDSRQHDLKRLAHLRHKINRVQTEHRSDRFRIEQLERLVENLTNKQLEQSSLEEQRTNLNEQHEQLQKMFVMFSGMFDGNSDRFTGLTKSKDATGSEETKLENADSDVIDIGYRNTEANGETKNVEDTIVSHRHEVSRNNDVSRKEVSGNEIAATQWMAEEVARVQNVVKEVEEQCNITSAIHDREVIANRLQALESDYVILRKEVSSAVSKSESTQALLEAYRQEDKSQISEEHSNGARVATLESQVASMREDFNEALASLPDGVLSPGYGVEKSKTQGSMHETEAVLPSTTNSTQIDDRHYGEWIQNLRSSLSKVRESSVQLLDAVDNLEIRQETDRVQLLREIAKLEFNVSTTSEEMKIYQDNIKKEYGFFSDILKVKDTVDKLQKELLEKDARITDTNYRLESLAGTVFEFMKNIKSELGIADEENIDLNEGSFYKQKHETEPQNKLNES